MQDELHARDSLERECAWLRELRSALEQRIVSLEAAAAALERDREGEREWLRDGISKLEQ